MRQFLILSLSPGPLQYELFLGAVANGAMLLDKNSSHHCYTDYHLKNGS